MVSISSYSLAATSRNAVSQAQSDLSKVQQELSSGKKSDIGLSLGAGSSRILSLNLQADQLQSFTDNNSFANTRLTATTSAVTALQGTATSFLSTLASSHSQSASISALVATAQSNLAALTSTLNTSVGGQYIFGGINADQSPMTAYSTAPPSATKQAVDDSFQATFGFSQSSPAAAGVTADQMTRYLTTAFASLFSASNYPGTWSAASDRVGETRISPDETATTSVSANDAAFRSLSQAYAMVSEFSGPPMNTAASQAVISQATNLISSATAGLIGINSDVGVAQGAINDANDRMSTQIGLLTTQSNALQGVDMNALSVSVSTLQTQIQASYEITAKLQSLSLVAYLS